MKSEKFSNRKTYYRKSQLNSFVFFAIVAIFAVIAKLPTLLVVMLSLFAVLMAYSAIQIRLIISPAGIEYYQVGYSVKTTWDNIARIGKIPTGRIMAEGLILSEPALFVSSWLARVKYIQTRGKLIPLSSFKRNWKASELGQNIKKYAPRLFVEE